MTRSRKTAVRTLRFEVRVTVEEDALISASAEKLCITKSEYVRRMAVDGQVVVRRDSAYGMSLAHQLKKVGVNLNQLTRVANANGELAEELARLCGRMEVILDRVVEMETGTDGPS